MKIHNKSSEMLVVYEDEIMLAWTVARLLDRFE
jgi:hypothetical protein